jgi:uncharacterized protein YbjT (DUF2867 family)
VVGANGFVGKALVSTLVEARYDVVALARRTPSIPGAQGRSVDVANEAALREALTGSEIGYYLAWIRSPRDT